MNELIFYFCLFLYLLSSIIYLVSYKVSTCFFCMLTYMISSIVCINSFMKEVFLSIIFCVLWISAILISYVFICVCSDIWMKIFFNNRKFVFFMILMFFVFVLFIDTNNIYSNFDYSYMSYNALCFGYWGAFYFWIFSIFSVCLHFVLVIFIIKKTYFQGSIIKLCM